MSGPKRLCGFLTVVVIFSAACAGTSESNVPAAVPTFVNLSEVVGFTQSHGTRKKEPDCLFDPNAIRAAFPAVTPPAVSRDIARQCDPERSAGGAAAVDVNNDGLDDIVMTRIYGTPLLYINTSVNGTPSFQNMTKGSSFENVTAATNGVGFADIDKDGDNDVVLTSLAGQQLFLFINDGEGKFSEQAVERGVAMIDGRPHLGMGVSFGDYDNDGWIDMHTNEWQLSDTAAYAVPSHSRLFRNNGDRGKPGYFTDTTEKAGVKLESRIDFVFSFSSRFTDFDGDGFPELSIAADFNTSRFFWNNKDGTFTEGTVDAGLGKEENGMGLAAAFFGPEQKPALMISSIRAKPNCDDGGDLLRTGNRLYTYAGERRFDDVTDSAGVRNSNWGWGVGFVDSTNAGKRDIFSAAGMAITWDNGTQCYSTDPFRFWVDQGDGVFAEKALDAGLGVSTPTKGVVVFDADKDGKQDLFVTRDADTPLFFHNQTPQVGTWLDIKVVGVGSNTNAFGARIDVTAFEDGPTQSAFVGTSSTFLTQDSNVSHFGFGSVSGKIHMVKVTFPATGEVVTLNNVKARQIVTVVEPTS